MNSRRSRRSIPRSTIRKYSLSHSNVSYWTLPDQDWDEEEHNVSLWHYCIDFIEDIKYFFQDLTYDNAKAYMTYFLEHLTINISVRPSHCGEHDTVLIVGMWNMEMLV